MARVIAGILGSPRKFKLQARRVDDVACHDVLRDDDVALLNDTMLMILLDVLDAA